MSINRKKLVEEVLEDIRSAHRHIDISSRADMRDSSIPRSQAIVMHIINSHPGISVKDVAITLDVSPSAATQLIDSLVKDGTVIRTPSEHDRRVVSLNLSKEGRVRHRRYKAFQLARLSPIMAVLTDEELMEFGRLSNKINTEVKSHISMAAFTPESSGK